jgi:hypothetical protein
MSDYIPDVFRAKVGSTFVLDETGIELVLAEVNELSESAFDVVFHGPAEPVMAQSVYTFRASDDSNDQFFIVPIGSTTSGAMAYEAVFTSIPAD